MKFIVKRTSVWDNKQPCDEAILEKVPNYDQRNFKSPEEHDLCLKEKWFSRGTEHSINTRGIVRRLEDIDIWVININSLEELLSFYKKYGQLVISSSYFNRQPEIEIYDDYRE
jgi:hypothetical protein